MDTVFKKITAESFWNNFQHKVNEHIRDIHKKWKTRSEFTDLILKEISNKVLEDVEYEKAGFTCEKCGSDMIVRNGRYGSFYACSNYPECKNTKQKVTEIGVKCPICSQMLVSKRGRAKTLFYSCSKYPECNFSSWDLSYSDATGSIFFFS